MASQVTYRHPCGAVSSEVTPSLDPRWGYGPCRCHDKGPWTRQSNEEDEKRDGMDRAAIHTADWQHVAKDWVISRPSDTPLISDDVTAAIGVPPSQGAVGALFNALASGGYLRPDGYTKSRRTGRHASMVRRWVRT